jgi:hypothetical protein
MKEPNPSEREREEVKRDHEVKKKTKPKIANERVSDETYEADHSSSAS